MAVFQRTISCLDIQRAPSHIASFEPIRLPFETPYRLISDVLLGAHTNEAPHGLGFQDRPDDRTPEHGFALGETPYPGRNTREPRCRLRPDRREKTDGVA